MKAFTVCVECADILAVTLPHNLPHFEELVVITSPTDWATRNLAQRLFEEGENVSLFMTTAFTRDGAVMNKGLAIERALAEFSGEGWVAVVDADIILPGRIDWPSNKTCLYGIHRRIVENPADYHDGVDWMKFPIQKECDLSGYLPHLEGIGLGGFFHLFHTSCHYLGKLPWYGTKWKHCGGYDSEFEAKFPPEKRIRLPVECLHLGKPGGVNWAGRVTPYLNGTVPPEAEARAAAMQEMLAQRVDYGYTKERLS